MKKRKKIIKRNEKLFLKIETIRKHNENISKNVFFFLF